MDKAVEIDPITYLGIRGSLKCKFVADYEGAIADIDELTIIMNGNDIGPTHDGTYHLNIVKALSYKELDRIEEAIKVIEEQLDKKTHVIGSYDLLHLGVLLLHNGEYEKAIEQLTKQISEYDIAENRYYLAQAYRGINDQVSWQEQIKISKEYILNNRTMKDPYNELFDKVYEEDIDEELSTAWQ